MEKPDGTILVILTWNLVQSQQQSSSQPLSGYKERNDLRWQALMKRRLKTTSAGTEHQNSINTSTFHRALVSLWRARLTLLHSLWNQLLFALPAAFMSRFLYISISHTHTPWRRLPWWCHTQSGWRCSGPDSATWQMSWSCWSTSPWSHNAPCEKHYN